MSSVKLQELKEQLRALGGFHEQEYLHSGESGGSPSNLPNKLQTIPKGAITQVIGPGKTGEIVQFLAHSPQFKIAWIESELSIYPNALLQQKLSLQNILFVECGREFVWTSLQILASSLFDAIILTLSEQDKKVFKDLRVLRRLQLAAEKSKCSLIFLSDEALSAWPIAKTYICSGDSSPRRKVKSK